jgi:hypothetical protein
MRTTAAVAALTVVAFQSFSFSQGPPSLERPSVQFNAGNSEHALVVEGCLQGNRLRLLNEPNVVADGLQIRDLMLEGPEGVMKSLRQEHDGHQDEITGMLLVPADRDVQIQGKRYGRTRVTAVNEGADPVGRVRPPAPQSQQQHWLRMKVTTLRHLSSKCSILVPPLCVAGPCPQ